MIRYAATQKWWDRLVGLLVLDNCQRPAVKLDLPRSAPSPKSSAEKLAGQPVGRKLKIADYELPPDIYQRLLEMGLTRGTECSVVRYAPMGDPIELKVRGYSLSLRMAEAAGVQVSCH